MNWARFLDIGVNRFASICHACDMMRNPSHLLVETLAPSLSQGKGRVGEVRGYSVPTRASRAVGSATPVIVIPMVLAATRAPESLD